MKQTTCYISNDGKFNSIDKRAVQEYELKEKICKLFLTENDDFCFDTLTRNMIDNAQWFYDFFNEICYPESCDLVDDRGFETIKPIFVTE